MHFTKLLLGKPTVSWTMLSETAAYGQRIIVLQNPVSWSAGDEIIVCTTGDLHSMHQTEEMTIASVSDDGRTVTLQADLEYTHLGKNNYYYY